ncbi:putative high mobility group protein -like tdp-1 [Leptomonas seymouri]|uniref:Putative high mobility group protein-like tdp-1 n=1 Tax=Leptomonas seymouri TaxID=5684 RepID=A0A0N0P8C9_LEPSE|nr:putative high mobility group protein -like tdp-1 [Leptomonas seymouri]|eukprot:KPI89809.1 putative high mobility group protein -like tdp-1 [Leptomonas seymouri]
MSELPAGPLPTDLEQSMLQIMHDVGLSSLTKNILRKRLEAKYKIEFASHAAEVDKVVSRLMMTPEIQRELAKIQQEKESVSARRAGAKRSASSDKKSKKEAKKESKREVKEKKPEDYPRAALSSYFIFVNENRDKVKAKNPDAKLTQVLSEVGHMWKVLPDSEKARYQKLADEDKKRFDADMEAYIAKGGKVFKRGGKSSKTSKKAKDPNAPKRAMSAYFFFAGDYRAKHSGVPAKQQMSEAGAAWGKMSDEEKKPYEELAAKDRKRYEAERAAQGGSKPSAKADASESESSSDSGSDSEESD